MSRHVKSTLARYGRERLEKILREDYDLVAEDTDSDEELRRIILEQQAAADYKAKEDAELAAGKDTPEKPGADWQRDRVEVIFDEQAGDGGQDSIKLALNGITYNVPRGVPVSLPRAVLRACVDDARMTLYSSQTDDRGRVTVSKRDVPRFTYRVVRDRSVA
jgi:hypothetical protein